MRRKVQAGNSFREATAPVLPITAAYYAHHWILPVSPILAPPRFAMGQFSQALANLALPTSACQAGLSLSWRPVPPMVPGCHIVLATVARRGLPRFSALGLKLLLAPPTMRVLAQSIMKSKEKAWIRGTCQPVVVKMETKALHFPQKEPVPRKELGGSLKNGRVWNRYSCEPDSRQPDRE